ncbi:putative membrane protein [Mucilaginibacter frigoritolerans]|jgi:uncharacterized membrane protein|uniref:Putative membrane protein n=1 Tax=Mucilaginibacter frigoritolerans TaxID=652788 RepID=A0A562UEZ3_9SPHI|nr:DUF1634 domain-containing protein [Mucilaginibacter frigoritolerans]TWJ04350.1 putative membrane protein [Mucilaginibacter frigoritolerans]
MAKFKDTDIQGLIGHVLRIGTIISVSIVFIGGAFYLYRHGQTIANYKVFTGIPDFVQHPGSLIYGAFTLRGQAIIQLGIILLIATPVLRVVFSAIGFAMEKDYLYVAISILVLLIIFISLLNGHAG